MKSLIYKYPVISALAINFMTLILFIYSINQRIIPLKMSVVLARVVNRRIIDNGQNIDKQKKTIIYISFLLIIITFLTYSTYIYNVRRMRIINGL